ncbi:hypothetical protein GY45DRAFT_1278815 [Cubamyces sp. BRFM 1775]|nr:hypothetical protein GY45DRAFT_1278815 [Cubamyces sp. BRFM 1775]
MAAKLQLPQDNTGSSVLSQMPPAVSLASTVLASTISLPEHPLIAYSAFTCLPATPDPLEQLELARRRVLHRNKDKPFLDSLHPIVHVSKDTYALYVFAVGSTHRTCNAHDALIKLDLDTLTRKFIYFYAWRLPSALDKMHIPWKTRDICSHGTLVTMN